MQFKPEKTLVFNFQEGKHLPTTLILKNTSSTNIYFKFKVSAVHKFSIRPNNFGMLKSGEEIHIQVVIHRDIVMTASEEKIQVIYGPNYQESRYFQLVVQNANRTDKLNLTMMINEKEDRIKYLENEVKNYRSSPITSSSKSKSKGGNSPFGLILALIIGILLGYYSPIKLFG